MSFLSKLFGENDGEIQIASRKPVGRFKTKKTFEIVGKQVIVGEVIEGVIYPGYKLKGEGVALIREIQKDRQRVDFAVEYDRVALVLEGIIKAREGEVLEVYQS